MPDHTTEVPEAKTRNDAARALARWQSGITDDMPGVQPTRERLAAAVQAVDLVVPFLTAPLREELERLAAECCRCVECGHVQAEPNWCHGCGHRTEPQPWAKRLLDELAAVNARADPAERRLEEIGRCLAPLIERDVTGDRLSLAGTPADTALGIHYVLATLQDSQVDGEGEKQTRVFDFEGRRIAVGSRVKQADGQPGTVEFIDDPEVDVDEDGRDLPIAAGVGVLWDDCDDREKAERISTVWIGRADDLPDFECEDLEVLGVAPTHPESTEGGDDRG